MQYLFLILLAMNAYSGEAKSAPRIELLLPGPRVAAIPYPTYLKCKITCTPKTECTDQCANKILESKSYKATLKRFPKLSENKDFSVCIQENVSRTKAGNSQWPVEAVIINCLHRKPGQSDPWIAAFPSQIRDERGAMVSKNGFKIVLKPEVEDKLSELRDAWGEGLKPSPILTPSKTQNKNLVANPNDCPPNWLAGKADSAGMFECQPSCFYSQDRNWQEYMTVVNNSCVHKCDQQNLKSEKTTSQIFIDGTCQACPKGYHRGPSNECVDASGCTPEQKIGRHGQCIPKTCDSKISEDRDFPLDQTGACSNKKTRCEAILNITKDLKSELETLNDSSGRTRSNTAKEISAIKDLVQFSELHFGDLPSCLRKEERAFSEFMAKSIYLAMVQSRDSLLKN